MDIKDVATRGGRAKSPAKTKAARLNGASSWKGHKKGDTKCKCKQCRARRLKSKKP